MNLVKLFTFNFALILSLVLFSCKDQDEKPKKNNDDTNQPPINTTMVWNTQQLALLLKFTSTGCPGCGSWGNPTFKDLKKKYPEETVALAAHIKYGDPMITAISEDLGNNRTGTRYTPQLWVNNENGMILSNSSINGTQTIANISNNVEETFSDSASFSIGGFIQLNDENQVELDYGIIPKINSEEKYYLAAYVLEDNVLYKQASASNNPESHNYVIRASAEGSFGLELESFNSNDTLNFMQKINLQENWNVENIYLAVVLWKKENDRYLFVNGAEFRRP